MEDPIRAGFLIVETYEKLFREFPKPWDGEGFFYGIPKKGASFYEYEKRYRGIDRLPLFACTEKLEEYLRDHESSSLSAAEAQRYLSELEDRGLSDNGFVFSLEHALAVVSLIRNPQDFELMWAADSAFDAIPPEGWVLLGYEPTWFTGDHFSAVADCLFFPRWHGPDREGSLFRDHYDALNKHGLFNTAQEAIGYLEYYQSFDWTETGDYLIAEIRCQQGD